MLVVCGTLMLDQIKEKKKPNYTIAGGSLPYMLLAAAKKSKPCAFSVSYNDWPKPILRMLKKYADIEHIIYNTERKSARHLINMENECVNITVEDECFDEFSNFPKTLCNDTSTLLLGSIDPRIQHEIILKTPKSFHITALHDTMSMENVKTALDVLRRSDIVLVNNEVLRKMTGHRTYFDSIRHLSKSMMGVMLVQYNDDLAVWDKKLKRKMFYDINGMLNNSRVGHIDAMLGGVAGAIDSGMECMEALEYGWALGMLSMHGAGFSEMWDMSDFHIELIQDQNHFLRTGTKRQGFDSDPIE